MKDLTCIEQEGQFASCIREYFYDNRPERIIETGLYHGTGSTKVIATMIRGIPLDNAEFYSIECSKENVEIGSNNLRSDQLLDYVEICNGLSIPKDLLPSPEKIKDTIAHAKANGMVKLDHEQDPDNGHNYYEKETASFLEDDLLGKIINKMKGQVDFILLDSGGHIGNVEFEYAISLIKSPCGIALDDTRHIKHYRCLDRMKKDKRFRILKDNEEKFGSALAIFTP